jgi:sterol 24-C-methyltransferase
MAMEGQLSRVTAISTSEAIRKEDVQSVVTDYKKLFDENQGGSVAVRNENYTSMVNDFYNMVTQFYEFGWGQSFHFAPRHKWESFPASIARHEMLLAHKLGLKPGMVALDMGCGIGGPGRVMARFSEAKIVGLNNNDYQLTRCKKLTTEQGLSHLCSYFKADWMHMPTEDNTYDAIFHVEALEHSPDRVASFTEIYRVLKPGALFGGYDWVVTDKYDANNPEHVRLKKGIELGNGLPDLQRPEDILDAMKTAGFEIIETKDYGICTNPDTEIPWYDSLEGKYWSLTGFRHTPLGMWLTDKMVWAMESCKIAPKGTHEIHGLLFAVAKDLVAGGKLGIFSPTYFYLARKPK